MISGMINLADSIGCKRPIYINILHSLRGQEHDIYYGLSFYVPDLITKQTVLGSGVYLSSGGGIRLDIITTSHDSWALYVWRRWTQISRIWGSSLNSCDIMGFVFGFLPFHQLPHPIAVLQELVALWSDDMEAHNSWQRFFLCFPHGVWPHWAAIETTGAKVGFVKSE